MNDAELEKLWEKLGDVPMDGKECIDADFYIWKKGTERDDIWHWFDEEHSIGVHILMYGK